MDIYSFKSVTAFFLGMEGETEGFICYCCNSRPLLLYPSLSFVELSYEANGKSCENNNNDHKSHPESLGE